MELTKEEAMCAWAYAYLDSFMAFTPSALQQHDFLGSINGAINRNLGLLNAFKNDHGARYQHAFALSLTLMEHWSIRQYWKYDSEQFDVEAYHYAFWAMANVFLKTAGWPAEFCSSVHMTSMTHYLVSPGKLNIDDFAKKVLILTAGGVNKFEIFEKLKFFLYAFDEHFSRETIDSGIQTKIRHSLYVDPASTKSIIGFAKAPGSLFDVIHRPFPGREINSSSITQDSVPPPVTVPAEESSEPERKAIEPPEQAEPDLRNGQLAHSQIESYAEPEAKTKESSFIPLWVKYALLFGLVSALTKLISRL